MAFRCGYCGQKKDYGCYIEGKERPCCAKCNRVWKGVKDDPNNPYSLTAKRKRGEIK
jgi:hypothetical protein